MVPSRLERLIRERDFQIGEFRKEVSNYKDRVNNFKVRNSRHVEYRRKNIIRRNSRIFREILKMERKKKKKRYPIVHDRNGANARAVIYREKKIKKISNSSESEEEMRRSRAFQFPEHKGREVEQTGCLRLPIFPGVESERRTHSDDIDRPMREPNGKYHDRFEEKSRATLRERFGRSFKGRNAWRKPGMAAERSKGWVLEANGVTTPLSRHGKVSSPPRRKLIPNPLSLILSLSLLLSFSLAR